MIKKSTILFFFILILTHCLHSQTATITNVEKNNNNVVITYNINSSTDNTFTVELWYSLDGSAFKKCNSTSTTEGDLNNIKTGQSKQIVWDVLKDVSKIIATTMDFEIRIKKNFSTNRNAKSDGLSFTDSRDGKTYKTVKIGNQTWMAENLNYFTSSGSWCYDNNTSNCTKYGRLYDWETAKNVCPIGWHLPSDAEWTTLIDNLGGEIAAGTKIKSTSDWNDYNGMSGNGTNTSGFTGLPGGYRNINGAFFTIFKDGDWWSSTDEEPGSAYSYSLNYSSGKVYRNYCNKETGFSVRCIKDN